VGVKEPFAFAVIFALAYLFAIPLGMGLKLSSIGRYIEFVFVNQLSSLGFVDAAKL
jgi:hypothetical protein